MREQILENPFLGHLHSISIFFLPNNFSLLLHFTVHFRNLVVARMMQSRSILSSSNFSFSGSHVIHFESSSAFHLYFPFSFCLHFTLLLAFDTKPCLQTVLHWSFLHFTLTAFSGVFGFKWVQKSIRSKLS